MCNLEVKVQQAWISSWRGWGLLPTTKEKNTRATDGVSGYMFSDHLAAYFLTVWGNSDSCFWLFTERNGSLPLCWTRKCWISLLFECGWLEATYLRKRACWYCEETSHLSILKTRFFFYCHVISPFPFNLNWILQLLFTLMKIGIEHIMGVYFQVLVYVCYKRSDRFWKDAKKAFLVLRSVPLDAPNWVLFL